MTRLTDTPIDMELERGYDAPTEPLVPVRSVVPSTPRRTEPAVRHRPPARRPAEITLEDVRGLSRPQSGRRSSSRDASPWWRRLFQS